MNVGMYLSLVYYDALKSKEWLRNSGQTSSAAFKPAGKGSEQIDRRPQSEDCAEAYTIV